MLTLHFYPLCRSWLPTFPAVRRVIIRGPELRADGNSAIAATYRNHFWQVGPAFSTSIEVRGRCTVRFETENHFSFLFTARQGCNFADGCFRLGLPGREVLAQFDETEQLWFLNPEAAHYFTIVIETA